MRILRNQSSEAGGSPQGGNNPAPAPGSAAPPVAQPVPPAARTVIEGKTEREIFLEQELEKKNRRERELETQVSERDRDIQNLRHPSVPAPVPKVKKEKPIFSTVLDDDDEEEN